MPKTYVYIDGFNLYYGSLRGNKMGRKWLDLQSWLTKLLPGHDIRKIKFFTAKVTGKHDPQRPVRQNTYLRALGTLPNLEVVYGNFLNKTVKIQVTQDVTITGRVPEEKGTDVDIATHLVNDAHLKKFGVGIIVSNDSDLSEAVKIATQELKLQIGIINPCMGRGFSKELTRHANFKKKVREGAILNSQFPAMLTDAVGQFSKPPIW